MDRWQGRMSIETTAPTMKAVALYTMGHSRQVATKFDWTLGPSALWRYGSPWQQTEVVTFKYSCYFSIGRWRIYSCIYAKTQH